MSLPTADTTFVRGIVDIIFKVTGDARKAVDTAKQITKQVEQISSTGDNIKKVARGYEQLGGALQGTTKIGKQVAQASQTMGDSIKATASATGELTKKVPRIKEVGRTFAQISSPTNKKNFIQLGQQMRFISRDLGRIALLTTLATAPLVGFLYLVTTVGGRAGGAVDDMRDSFERIAVTIDDVLGPFLEFFARLSDSVATFLEGNKAVALFVGGLIILVVIASQLGALFLSFISTLGLIQFGLRALVKEVNQVSGASLGFGGVLTGLIKGTDVFEKGVGQMGVQIHGLGISMGDALHGAKLLGKAIIGITLATIAFQALGPVAEEVFSALQPIFDAIETIIQPILPIIENAADAISRFMDKGPAFAAIVLLIVGLLADWIFLNGRITKSLFGIAKAFFNFGRDPKKAIGDIVDGFKDVGTSIKDAVVTSVKAKVGLGDLAKEFKVAKGSEIAKHIDTLVTSMGEVRIKNPIQLTNPYKGGDIDTIFRFNAADKESIAILDQLNLAQKQSQVTAEDGLRIRKFETNSYAMLATNAQFLTQVNNANAIIERKNLEKNKGTLTDYTERLTAIEQARTAARITPKSFQQFPISEPDTGTVSKIKDAFRVIATGQSGIAKAGEGASDAVSTLSEQVLPIAEISQASSGISSLAEGLGLFGGAWDAMGTTAKEVLAEIIIGLSEVKNSLNTFKELPAPPIRALLENVSMKMPPVVPKGQEIIVSQNKELAKTLKFLDDLRTSIGKPNLDWTKSFSGAKGAITKAIQDKKDALAKVATPVKNLAKGATAGVKEVVSSTAAPIQEATKIIQGQKDTSTVAMDKIVTKQKKAAQSLNRIKNVPGATAKAFSEGIAKDAQVAEKKTVDFAKKLGIIEDKITPIKNAAKTAFTGVKEVIASTASPIIETSRSIHDLISMADSAKFGSIGGVNNPAVIFSKAGKAISGQFLPYVRDAINSMDELGGIKVDLVKQLLAGGEKLPNIKKQLGETMVGSLPTGFEKGIPTFLTDTAKSGQAEMRRTNEVINTVMKSVSGVNMELGKERMLFLTMPDNSKLAIPFERVDSAIQAMGKESGVLEAHLAKIQGAAKAVNITDEIPKKFAKGGLVPGLGSKDTVPALLTPGEFVLPKKIVASYKGKVLEKLKTGWDWAKDTKDKMTGYAKGGIVKKAKTGPGSYEKLTNYFDNTTATTLDQVAPLRKQADIDLKTVIINRTIPSMKGKVKDVEASLGSAMDEEEDIKETARKMNKSLPATGSPVPDELHDMTKKTQKKITGFTRGGIVPKIRGKIEDFRKVWKDVLEKPNTTIAQKIGHGAMKLDDLYFSNMLKTGGENIQEAKDIINRVGGIKNKITEKIPHFAKGGIVPGVGNKDTVPAMLTPGEIVLPKKAKNIAGDIAKIVEKGIGKIEKVGTEIADKLFDPIVNAEKKVKHTPSNIVKSFKDTFSKIKGPVLDPAYSATGATGDFGNEEDKSGKKDTKKVSRIRKLVKGFSLLTLGIGAAVTGMAALDPLMEILAPILQSLSDAIITLLEPLTPFIDQIANWIDNNTALAGSLGLLLTVLGSAGFLGILGPLLGGIGKIAGAVWGLIGPADAAAGAYSGLFGPGAVGEVTVASGGVSAALGTVAIAAAAFLAVLAGAALITDAYKSNFGGLKDATDSFVKTIQKSSPELATALTGLGSAFMGIGDIGNTIFDLLTGNWDKAGKDWKSAQDEIIQGTMGWVKGIGGLLTNVIGWFQLLATDPVTAMRQLGQGIGDTVSVIVKNFQQLGLDIVNAVVGGLTSAGDAIVKGVIQWVTFFSNPIQNIQDLVNNLFQGLQQMFQQGLAILSGIWNGLWGGLTNVVKGVMDFIGNIVSGALGFIEGLFGLAPGTLVKPWQDAWNNIEGVVMNVLGGIKGFIDSVFTGIINTVSGAATTLLGVFNVMMTAIGVVWNTIASTAGTAWTAITGILTTAWNVMLGAFSTVWGGMQSIFDGFMKVFQPAINLLIGTGGQIIGAFQGVVDFFAGIPDKIVGFFSGIGDKITGFFTGAVKTIQDDLKPLIDTYNAIAGTLGLPQISTVTATTATTPAIVGNPNVGGHGHASGGIVPGMGSQDNVPAFLTPGEWIIPADIARNLTAFNPSALLSSLFGGTAGPGGNQPQVTPAPGNQEINIGPFYITSTDPKTNAEEIRTIIRQELSRRGV